VHSHLGRCKVQWRVAADLGLDVGVCTSCEQHRHYLYLVAFDGAVEHGPLAAAAGVRVRACRPGACFRRAKIVGGAAMSWVGRVEREETWEWEGEGARCGPVV
jgi:hypothetical protein